MAQKDVLFFGLHRPNRSPSQRYRIEQFLPYLDANKVTYDYDYILNEKRDKIFYAPGNLIGKAYIVFFGLMKLFWLCFYKAKKYKTVFVQREMFMLGTAFFEKQIAKRTRLVFDFDDSIWMQNVSAANKKWAFLKNADKTKEIIEVADTVIVGNQYLADYALQFNQNVHIIPTLIDTNEYKRTSALQAKANGKVCIGWSGSQTTIEHFKLAIPYLLKLKEKYGNTIYIKVIGDESFQNEALGIQGIKWQRATEIAELEEIDIGIMPLPQDEWSKGKCGLKGLVYLAMEIPAVLENHGANKEIIQDGVNGFLASNENEWIEKLFLLIENESLRKEFSQKGKVMLDEKYAIKAYEKLFLQLLRA